MREEGETWDEAFSEEGKLIVASDGACPNQQGDSRARRSGQGLFYGEGHACNSSWPTDTYSQGAQRAEVRAAARWVAWAWGPTELWTDSALVVKGMRNILSGFAHGMKGHRDLWRRIELGINAKGKENFAVKKVKGHMKEKECKGNEQLLEEKRRNDKADELAVKAAEDAEVSKKLTAVSKQERKLVRDIQRMMVDIALQRYQALKAMKEGELERRLGAAKGHKDETENGSPEKHKPAEEEKKEEEEEGEEDIWRSLQWDEEQEEEDIWGDIDINGNEVERGRPSQANRGGGSMGQEEKQKEQEDKQETERVSETENTTTSNPALAEGRRDFPQYQWDEQGGG